MHFNIYIKFKTNYFIPIIYLTFSNVANRLCTVIMDIIDHEITWYKANRPELIKDYEGKFLIIRGEQLAGVYNSLTEAKESASLQFAYGTYIIEHPVDITKRRGQDSPNVKRK